MSLSKEERIRVGRIVFRKVERVGRVKVLERGCKAEARS